MRFFNKGFAKLDFAQARVIAQRVGFDVALCGRRKKGCGPGCDYLVHDKRYYLTMLLNHIQKLEESGSALPEDVQQWYTAARIAAAEYAQIEQITEPHIRTKTQNPPEEV